MNSNFDRAITDALEQEFSWTESFRESEEDHVFSHAFEAGMRRMLRQPQYAYTGAGRKWNRKKAMAVLIALLLMAATGCAVTKCIIHWNETKNEAQGTLDITFDIENPPENAPFIPVTPKTPKGYSVFQTEKLDMMYVVQYARDDNPDDMIYYFQDDAVENMSISIDNAEDSLTETTINGYKGYAYVRDETNALYWTDGNSFFTLQGICDMEVLWQMAEGIEAEK